jgi:pyruvate dehydrogenase E1 component alpha subunit
MQLQEVALEGPQLMSFLRQMILIRVFEEKAAEWYMRGRIGGFLHLYIGEEAIAVGGMAALAPQDYIVTHYRDHGHALARGTDPKLVMAELFGKATGTSKGKGGSMHIFDPERGFLGGYAIVASMMPLAVGLGFASQYLKEDRVILCIFGDGAVNEGEFHESLNLAALWKLPVVFLCENNGYGMGTPVAQTIAGNKIYRLADGYDIPSRQINGMDVLEMYESMRQAVVHARAGEGPIFLEALTYRYRGHSMADPMDYRLRAEEEEWRKKDPIQTFSSFLLERKVITEQQVKDLQTEVEREIEEAVQFAEQSPDPKPAALYEDILHTPGESKPWR